MTVAVRWLRFEWKPALVVFLVSPLIGVAVSRVPLVREFPGVIFIIIAIFASYYAGAVVGVLACAEVVIVADALGIRNNANVINQADILVAFGLAALAGVVVSRAFVRERRSLASLAESEQRHRQLLAATFDAVILSVDGTIVEVDTGFERLWGYTAVEAVGRPLLDFVAPDFVPTLQANLAAELAEPIELGIVARQGSEHIVRVVAQRVVYGGMPARLSAVTDVTAERLVEAERVAAERRYRTLFESVPVGVTLASIDGIYLEANEIFCRLAGRSREEVVGHHFTEFAPPGEGGDPEVLDAILRGESGPFNFEASVLDPLGIGTPVRVSVALVRDEDGAPLYTVTVLESIAEQRQLEAQVRQTQKMEAIGRLASGIAHDFNNLLTVIGGNVMLLDSVGLDAEARRRVQEIGAAADRASGLTRQLLTFSRPREPRLDNVDLNELVDDVVDGLLRRLIGAKVVVKAQLANDLPPVLADGLELEQVIINLAVNARDAMPEGGSLTLSTDRAGDRVVLRVADTGSGIDEITREHIFEPFFTTKPRGEGTGLGLANVYGIVTRVGGAISVESEVGHGTTFEIALPIGGRVGPSAGDPEPVDLSRTGRVLFVDDEAAVRRIAETTLSRAGHRPVLAAGGEEALELLAAGEAIDLLVTDLEMPGMNGLELAERVRASRPQLGVLFISGYPGRVLGSRGEIDPDFDLLEKPFSPVVLLERVARALA
jgi:two-component system, cell cycle sensor histidine kinase and response regulator CckA